MDFAHRLICFGVLNFALGLLAPQLDLLLLGFNMLALSSCALLWLDFTVCCHPGIPVIQGDIADSSCLKAVAQAVEPPFTLMAGFSGQPFSTGGAQAGSEDDRSATVPATMKACHLFSVSCAAD